MRIIGHGARVAQRSPKCSLCGRAIRKGETYSWSTNIADYAPYTWNQCLHCSALVHAIDTDAGAYGWYDDDYGYRADEVAEYEPRSVSVLRLKAMWNRQWERRDGDLYALPAQERAR